MISAFLKILKPTTCKRKNFEFCILTLFHKTKCNMVGSKTAKPPLKQPKILIFKNTERKQPKTINKNCNSIMPINRIFSYFIQPINCNLFDNISQYKMLHINTTYYSGLVKQPTLDDFPGSKPISFNVCFVMSTCAATCCG